MAGQCAECGRRRSPSVCTGSPDVTAAPTANPGEVSVVLSDTLVTVDGAQAPQTADVAIIVTDLEGKVVFVYDPDKDETTGTHNRGYQGAVISCPQFQVGETYHVYIGGDVEGTETDGLYDASTVTGFSGAALQLDGKPDGFDPNSGNWEPAGGREPSTRLHMTDKVNAFSGVTDAPEGAEG